MNFYVKMFNKAPQSKNNSKIVSIARHEKGIDTPQSAEMEGKVLTGMFELNGESFMCLDGGTYFKLNPSISFHVKCASIAEVEFIWGRLIEGGEVLMPLDKYPFSDRYGWCNDKYGVSWQIINFGDHEFTQKITPMLIYAGDVYGRAEEAVNHYIAVFGQANLGHLLHYGNNEKPEKADALKYADFKLFGREFGAMDNAGEHHFQFNEAVSFFVECDDQAEVDRYWYKLSAVTESEQCGWLKDKFGVSWQIIPKRMMDLLADKNKEKAHRVMNEMLKMNKIIIEDLEKAYKG